MSSIFVIVYPTVQHNVIAPGTLYYRRWPSESGPLPTQPETNTHFIARFRPARFNVLAGLRQSPALDIPAVIQPETNTHFIARFRPVKFRPLPYFHGDTSQSGPLPLQPETNVHFVGKFRPAGFQLLPTLRQNAALDVALVALSETNTHFVGRFAPASFRLLQALRQNGALDIPVAAIVETNTHFLGKFRPLAFRRWSYFHWDTSQSGPLGIQPETNTHFVGRFNAARFFLARGLRQHSSLDGIPAPVVNLPGPLLVSAGYNISDATSLVIKITRPDGTIITAAGTVGSKDAYTWNGLYEAGTYAVYQPVAGDINLLGSYQVDLTYKGPTLHPVLLHNNFFVTDLTSFATSPSSSPYGLVAVQNVVWF